MKVPRKTPVPTPWEPHLQHPHAPKRIKFIFFKQNEHTGARSAAPQYRRKGSLTDSCLIESNPASVTPKQQFNFT